MSWLTKFRCFYLGITPKEMKQTDCPHPNLSIDVHTFECITFIPKEGKCRLCGKNVKAKITWR